MSTPSDTNKQNSEISEKAHHQSDAKETQGNKLTWLEHFNLSFFWFATNFHWGAIIFLLLPGDMQLLAGANKANMVGFITGFGAIFALVIPLIAGALSDRSGHSMGRRRPFLIVGTTVNCIGLGIMALQVSNGGAGGSIPMYIFGYIVVNIGNNIASGAYMGLIPDVVPDHDRGRASGFMALKTQLGTLFGIVILGKVLGDAPVTLKYAVIISVLIFICFWTCITVKEDKHTPTEKFRLVEYIKSLWISPKEHPNFAWVWITRFLVMLGFYSIVPFINFYMSDVVGIPVKEVNSKAPILMGVILLFSSITGVLGGALSDKIGRKKVVFLANGMIAIVTPFFIFASNLPIVLVVGVLFGLGYGAYISVDYALGTDVLPSKKDAGKDMAVWHIAMTLPQSLAAPIAGFLIARPGVTKDFLPGSTEPFYHYQLSGYATVFIMSSFFFALGAFLLKNLKGIS